jgi:hypothetical protein
MKRYNRLISIYKIAINKGQKNLGEEFVSSEMFSAENNKKVFAIAAQWWSAFNGTSVYENWKFLQNDLRNLNDVIRFIKQNKDSVERAGIEQESSNAEILSGIYPKFKDKFLDFNERFLAWLASRYGENSKYKNLHPIDQAIPTLEKYQEKIRDLRQKFDSNEKYRNLFNSLNSGAKNPSDIMKLSVNDMESAIGFSERPRDLHTIIPDNYEPKRFLGQFGPWKLWLPEGVSDSIAIAKYNKYSMLPDTEWCTGRTFGHNLFYDYTTGGTFLFYLIKDGATKDNLLDYQSIGVDGDILYNGDGAETVDGENNGMSEYDHRRLFGDYFEEIYSAIYSEVDKLGGIHPVEKQVNKAALGDKESYEELIRVGDPDTRQDIEQIIIDKKIVIAENTSDPELIEKFYNDKSLAVKRTIVSNPNISTEMIEDIYNNTSLGIKQFLIYNDKVFLPENIHILNGLATLKFNEETKINAQQIRSDIGADNRTPEAIIQKFFANKDIDGGISGYISYNTNYTEKAEGMYSAASRKYDRYSDDFQIKILAAMASSELTPPEILEKIYIFASGIIDNSIFLENKIIPVSVLNKIYDNTPGNDLNKMRQIRNHPNASTDLLSRMKKDKGILWQYESARNSQTPIEILEELSGSKYLEVLEALSENPAANTEVILNKLIKYIKLKQKIADRDDLPESTLNALSMDENGYIRKKIARKENAGREVLKRLSEDSYETVRRNVYNNPSTPIDIVIALSKEFYHSERGSWKGSSRFEEYQLGNEAFSIIDGLLDYEDILLNDGVNIDAEIAGDDKSIEKVNRLAKKIADAGSIVFYDADLTDLNLTQKYSNVWAANFIEKNKGRENLSPNESSALSLAKEIAQDVGVAESESEVDVAEEIANIAIDKISSLICWLSKSGYKKEAADITSLHKEVALKIKNESSLVV